MLAGMCRKRDFGKIDSAEGGTVVAVFDQLPRYLQTNVSLSLLGASGYVRGQDHVVSPAQRRNKFVGVALRLPGKNIHGGAAEMLRVKRLHQRVDVHDGAARRVN